MKRKKMTGVYLLTRLAQAVFRARAILTSSLLAESGKVGRTVKNT